MGVLVTRIKRLLIHISPDWPTHWPHGAIHESSNVPSWWTPRLFGSNAITPIWKKVSPPFGFKLKQVGKATVDEFQAVNVDAGERPDASAQYLNKLVPNHNSFSSDE